MMSAHFPRWTSALSSTKSQQTSWWSLTHPFLVLQSVQQSFPPLVLMRTSLCSCCHLPISSSKAQHPAFPRGNALQSPSHECLSQSWRSRLSINFVPKRRWCCSVFGGLRPQRRAEPQSCCALCGCWCKRAGLRQASGQRKEAEITERCSLHKWTRSVTKTRSHLGSLPGRDFDCLWG